jgi:hypothetical protein
MSAEVKKEIQLEIADVLFIDIVGYSKLSINDQLAETNCLSHARNCKKKEAASSLATRKRGK